MIEAADRIVLPGGIELRDYQAATLGELLNPPADVWRDLAVLATGGGKTIIFAALLHRLIPPGKRGLVLAHREELLTQARDKIAMVDPDLDVEIEQAGLRATRDFGFLANERRQVVVSSVQSLHKKRREQFAPDAFDVIIVDEAHHATAPTYVDILTYFGCFDEARRTRLVGVTATPNRSDGKGLGEVFQRIAAVYGIRELVDREWLVAPRAIRVNTETDLSSVKVTAGDFNVGELEDAVNTDSRNALIVAAYRRYAAQRQGIVFAAGVEHAGQLSRLFTDAGIPAEPVWGASGADIRHDTLDRFRRGELQVLTNFAVLTEGFDEPAVSAIVLARPTMSDLLMTQMVGRGLRLFTDKTDCICIDVQDITKRRKCISVPSLAGLPAGFDTGELDIFQAKKKLDSLDPRLVARAQSIEEVDRILERIAGGMSAVEVDILSGATADPVCAQYSRLTWASSGPDSYGIRVTSGGPELSISVDTLGKWRVFIRQIGGQWEPLFNDLPDAASAFTLADGYIGTRYDTKLIDRTARWRSDPCSEPQLRMLSKLGVFLSPDDATEFANQYSLSKGQASMLIDDALARQRDGQKIEPILSAYAKPDAAKIRAQVIEKRSTLIEQLAQIEDSETLERIAALLAGGHHAN